MATETQSGPLDDAAIDAMYARRRCCCCWILWPAPSRSAPPPSGEWWERIQSPEGQRRSSAPGEGGWWGRGLGALMKLREWSELVAGPRWKTFIRRFNRGGPRPAGGFQASRFGYDPLSYALNFDQGPEESPEGGYPAAGRDFSARFAVPPASAKSSMDLGGRDAPPLFANVSPAGR